MRRARSGSVVTSLGLGLLLGGAAPGVGAAPPEVAARRDHFREREDGRRLAQIDARLAGGVPTVKVSALGPRVDPQPGFGGAAGVNRLSARELTRLLERGALTARVLDERGRVVPAAIEAAAPRALPMRRTHPDGTVDLRAETAERWVPAIRCVCGPLPAGTGRFQILVGQEVRLEGALRADGGLGRFGEAGGLHRPPAGRP